MDLDESQAKFLQVEALSPSRYLYHISSLVDNRPYRCRRIVSLQESFTCISKFTGTVFLWCASRSNLDMRRKRSDFVTQTNYVSHTIHDLPRFFINYRRKVLEIPEFFNKLSRSALKQIMGKTKELQFIPTVSLAGYLVPSLDNTNLFAVSHENGNAVVGRSMNHNPCDVDQRRCSDLRYENYNVSTRAVEPRTGIEFPTILDNIFGGSNSSLNTEVHYY